MAGYVTIGILGLAVLMIVHEAGHFFAARAFGMRVITFSIGFGPTFFKIVPQDGYYWFTTIGGKVRLRLHKHKPEHGPTVFQFAMIPFLAYVQIAGMNPLEEHDPKDKGSYANASLLARIVTIFAGPLANYLFASVFFFFSYFAGGRPVHVDAPDTTIAVMDGRPAARADLHDGDRVLAVNGTPVAKWDEMAAQIQQHPDEAITLRVDRQGEELEVVVTTDAEDGKGKIGVGFLAPREDVSFGESLLLALKRPPEVVKDLVVGLGSWISGKAEVQLSGPGVIVKEMASAAKRGLPDLLNLMGALSAYLGAFNLFPFPALDGGRLMFLSYELATRRRPNARVEARIHIVGFIMLIGLVLYVTIFNDLKLGK
ncbi:MAG: site-2 protease family protein [Myxococcales bacterium]|nr:site-2 protease family protein [Myxococcales bacterium]